MVGTFEELWSQQSNAGPKDRGDRFEELSKWFLENDPVYKRLFSAVYGWKEWPGRWSDADNGIDLIAEGRNGQTWAIQCKGYGESAVITKADIDSFVAESTRPAIDNLLLMATKESIGPKVRKLLEETEKPAEWLLAEAFRSRDLDWPKDFASLRPAKQKRKTPRPHQLEAVKAIAQGLTYADRGQAIMACGTGKTFTSILVAEELKAQRILVLVPSIWLVSQTLSEWAASWHGDFRFLAVCSDQKAGDGSITSVNREELGIPSTTDSAEIKKWMKDSGAEPSVIFSTYQSSPLVREAANSSKNFKFDLAIADEAHRTATRGNSPFTEIHEGLRTLCSKTLFMTATPRILGKTVADELTSRGYVNYSMDNPKQFGEVVYELPFSAAINLDLLVDYEAVATIVSDGQIRGLMEERALVETDGGDDLEADELLAMIGLARRIHEQDLRRVITFHSKVQRAERFARYFQRTAQWAFPDSKKFKDLQHHAVSARVTGGERRRRISILSNQGSEGLALVSNARVLTEGVDIPAVDAIAFVDPKQSVVDITQAIGRVLRKSPGKAQGQVIIVAPLNEHEPIDEQLEEDSRLATIWKVVQALRAQDERLEDWLDSVRTELGRGRVSKPEGVAITIDAPWLVSNEVAEKIQLKVIEKTTESWDFMYGALLRLIDQTGSAYVRSGYVTEDGLKLGKWAKWQRWRYNLGTLRRNRIKLLESLPGWEWDAAFAEFLRKADLLERYFEEKQTNQILTDDQPYFDVDLRTFANRMRALKRGKTDGELREEHIRRLESIPGWLWEPKIERDERFIRPKLRRYVEVLLRYQDEFGPVVRKDSGSDYMGLNLFTWVSTVRGNRRKGLLRAAEIELVETIPSWEWDPGEDILAGQDLRDDTVRGWFANFCELLSSYQSEFQVSKVIKQSGRDYRGVNLYGTVNRVRRLWREKKLSKAEMALLESNPKWVWEPLNQIPTGIRKGPLNTAKRFAEFFEKAGSFVVRDDNKSLANSVQEMKKRFHSGELTPEEIALFESTPGWTWDRDAGRKLRHNMDFERQMLALERYFRETGENSLANATVDGVNLSDFAHRYRTRYREGRLSGEQIGRFEALFPLWKW